VEHLSEEVAVASHASHENDRGSMSCNLYKLEPFLETCNLDKLEPFLETCNLDKLEPFLETSEMDRMSNNQSQIGEKLHKTLTVVVQKSRVQHQEVKADP
jgi:hypothetical protein